jgi:ABC-type transporter Mla MlaB component
VLRKVRRERDTHVPIRSKPNLVQPNGAPGIPAGSAKEDTLRKINEIERMMSVDIKSSSAKAKDDREAQNRAFLPTQPMSASVNRPVVVPRAPASAGEPEMTEAQRMANAFARTDMMTQPMTRHLPRPQENAPGIYSADATQPSSMGSENFLNSVLMGATQMMAMDVQELSSDPVLEEAAIHFANAEYGDAELTLQNAVAPTGANHHNLETWRALFDLYRATGDQARFESVGLDFVGLFDTSAPNWFSLSGDVQAPAYQTNASSAGSAGGAANAGGGPAAYACPPRVDTFVANQMLQFVELRLMGGGVVMLDFSRLQSVHPDAAETLGKVLLSLNATAGKVSVIAPEKFSQSCETLTVTGDNTVPPALWAMRLEWLRLLGQHDAFETVALDYCVTYEVSPPSWVPSKSSYSQASAAGTNTGSGASGAVSMEPNWSLDPLTVSSSAPTQVMGRFDEAHPIPERAALQGEVTAGSIVITPDLVAAGQQAIVAINCAKLKRIDFASAGTLLNWVLELASDGKQIQFYDAHRLVAAFFNVIGISGHSRVILRRD